MKLHKIFPNKIHLLGFISVVLTFISFLTLFIYFVDAIWNSNSFVWFRNENKKYPMFLWIQLIQIWYSPVYKPIGFSNVEDNVIDGAIRKRQVWSDQADLRLLLRQMIEADDRSSELSSASVCECILLAVFCCDIHAWCTICRVLTRPLRILYQWGKNEFTIRNSHFVTFPRFSLKIFTNFGKIQLNIHLLYPI